MRSVFIMAVLLAVMLAACGGTVDSYDPRTPAFRRSSLTITAVPNRAIPDTPIVINTKGTALVSGKGRIGFHCYHNMQHAVMYVEQPAQHNMTFENARLSGDSAFAWIPFVFERDKEFSVEWSTRVNMPGTYAVTAVVRMDSVLSTDVSSYLGVLDSTAIRLSPGAKGYDWWMNFIEIYLYQ